MAVIHNQASGQPSQPAQPAQPSQGNTTTNPGSQTSTPFVFGNLFAAPISRSPGSDILNQLSKSINEILENARDQRMKSLKFKVLSIDRTDVIDLAFSVIMIAVEDTSQPQLGVAFHTLILEATGEKVQSLFYTVNNAQVEFVRVTGDAMDKKLYELMENRIKLEYPNRPVFFADACVVPGNFPVDNRNAVHNLTLNASLACSTELSRNNASFKDLSVGEHLRGHTMVMNVSFNRMTIEDSVGNPMRSDCKVVFNYIRPSVQGDRSVHTSQRATELSEVSGFIDLLWSPPGGQAGYNNPFLPATGTTIRYAPRFVITNLASNFAYTPGAVLLTLATAMAVRESNNWIQAFRPTALEKGEIDLRDVGALTIDVNLSGDPSGFGTRVDTRKESFRLENLGEMIMAFVSSGLLLSIDVPESGPQSWYLNFLRLASMGNPYGLKILNDSLDRLTNGLFSKYFDQNQPMFIDVGNRVHLGHWIDRHGKRRDIRDIDYLAIANLMGDQNPHLIRQWSETWTGTTQYTPEQKMAMRKALIMSATHESAEFTGFATRVTVSSAFLETLLRALSEAGLMSNIQTSVMTSDITAGRSAANFVAYGLSRPGVYGFNQPNTPGMGSYYSPFDPRS